MANIVYNKFKEQLAKGIDWSSGSVIRCLLERSTSTYVPNPDHDFVSSLTGLVEISVASYARQSVGTPTVTEDDTNDWAKLDGNDLAFGNLEAGQTVKALIFYIQTGGNDSSPTDDILVARYDTDSGGALPAALGGGAFNVQFNVNGLMTLS